MKKRRPRFINEQHTGQASKNNNNILLRKHCDTTGTQVADRLTDCERTRRLRRVRARGRIAVGVGVGRGGVAHGLLGRGR